MGCGSSTATRTAGQPAPKLNRIKEEEENATQSSTSRHAVNESNGQARRVKENEESGDESSRQQIGKVVTPSSSANGHVPHGSQENTGYSSRVSESTSDRPTNEGAETGTRDSIEPSRVEENTSNGPTATENQFNKEESLEERATASVHSASHSKVAVETEQPVVSTPVNEKGVPSSLAGDDVKPAAVEEKPSGLEDLSAGDEAASTANVTASDSDTGAAETDLPQHKVANEVSLSGENDTAPVVDQTKRASVAASENSTAPSDNEVNLSRQNRGSFELDSVSTAITEGAQPSQPREVSKGDSTMLDGKETLVSRRTKRDSVSFPAGSSESPQPTEISKKDSVPLGRKDSVGHPGEANDDFLVESESIYGRICTLTASVLIGSLDDPRGERTVTLHGSVYRLPRVTTPKAGDKIGFVTGDVTSTPVDNESSEKVATLRGDLLAVSGEAASHGQIATASIDVLSCATGEKVATITADVAPNDDSESASGVILGEVLGASESGSYDEKIGTLAGKVVALTFDEDTVSITSADEEFLKQRRESCFI